MHLWRNFTKQWKDKELRGAVWEAARASTPSQFNTVMERIKRKCEKAWAYLNKWPKESWTKAYFSTDPKVDNVPIIVSCCAYA
jgi:N-glycosylase/DNA lyase